MTTVKQMIEKFQCPGCVAGSDTRCGSYKSDEKPGDMCTSHVIGTVMSGAGNIALGLPRGFNRSGYCVEKKFTHNKMLIRFWPKGTLPEWNVFNIPVWVKTQDGYMFVRTYSPRVGWTYVDVIEDGTIESAVGAQNVTDLEMD